MAPESHVVRPQLSSSLSYLAVALCALIIFFSSSPYRRVKSHDVMTNDVTLSTENVLTELNTAHTRSSKPPRLLGPCMLFFLLFL